MLAFQQRLPALQIGYLLRRAGSNKFCGGFTLRKQRSNGFICTFSSDDG